MNTTDIIKETLRTTDVRPLLDELHKKIHALHERVGMVDKEIETLESTLGPITVSSPPVNPSTGGQVAPAPTPVNSAPPLCQISDVINHALEKLENLELRLLATANWVGTIRGDLRL